MRLDRVLGTVTPLSRREAAAAVRAGRVTVNGAAVTLPTAGCLLKQDVVVSAIPQFAVSNPAGGQTLIIGEEYFQHGN